MLCLLALLPIISRQLDASSFILSHPPPKARQSSSISPCLYEFNRLIATKKSQDSGTVVLAETNEGFKEMLMNWLNFVGNVNRSLLKHAVIVGLDESSKGMETKAGNIFYDHCDGNKHAPEAQEFRSQDYNKIVFHKWLITLRALRAGANVLLSDTDVVWLKDPLSEIVNTYGECDMALTTDDPLSKSDPTWQNTGFAYFKNTKGTIDALDHFMDWRKEASANLTGYDDQYAWNEFFSTKLLVSKDKKYFPCKTYKGKGIVFTLAVLPASKFMDFRHWQDALPSQREGAITLHYNWLSGYEKKREQMKLQGHWQANLTT